MSITNCDTHLTRTVRYLSLTFEPVYYRRLSYHLHFFKFLEYDYFNNSIISSSLFDNDLEISSKLIPFVSIALIPSFIN